MRPIINAFLSILVIAAASPAAFAQGKSAMTLQTVPRVELNKYIGKWYEIGRYPNKFQKQCVGNTAATYSLKKNGRIEVKNECLKNDGAVSTAIGEARVVDAKTNAKLKVRFAPKILSFLPAVWGDYWILDLDPGYQHVLIGDPSREYLWILSRDPGMGTAEYQQMLRKAESLGFDPAKIQKTPQNVDTGKGGVIDRTS